MARIPVRYFVCLSGAAVLVAGHAYGAESAAPLFGLSHATVAGMAGLAVVVGYYFSVWLSVGNKQFRRSVPLRPTPPDRVSPAALRYVDRMGYDESQLAVALLSMAVKGYLHIEDKDRILAVVRDEAAETVLAPEERDLAHRIFDGRHKLALSWTNRNLLSDLHRHFRYVLEARYRKKLFHAHTVLRSTGLALSAAVLAVMFGIHFVEAPDSDSARRLLDFAVGALCAGGGTLLSLHEYRRAQARRSGPMPVATGLVALVMSLLGIVLMVDAAGALIAADFGSSLFVVGALIAVNWLFLLRLPNYSRDGWRLMVEAEGYRRFVQAGYKPEHEDVSMDRLFEANLPYAVALGVGDSWAALFESALTHGPRADREELAYLPIWYAGLKWERQTPSDFVASLQRALTAAVTSMSAPAGQEGTYGRSRAKREKAPKQSPTGSRSED